VAAQVLDNVYAALLDAAIATGSAPLRNLAGAVLNEIRAHLTQPAMAVDALGNQSAALSNQAVALDNEAGFQALSNANAQEADRIQEILDDLAAALRIPAPDDWPERLEKLRLQADRLQCAGGRIVRERG
jgi:hypothetical protein